MSDMRPAVFLDRDGVLNEIVMRNSQPASPRSLEEMRLVPDLDALGRLAQAGHLIFITTNQPDIARGHITAEEARQMLDRIRARVHIDDFRICPHQDADGCGCRKPEPGMLLDLARHWRVDLARSWMIGDTWRDMRAAHRAGCRGVLIRRSYNSDVAVEFEAADLAGAVTEVLERRGVRGNGSEGR